MWLTITAVTVLVALYFRRGKVGPGEEREPAEEILKRRYASGEIDEKTYQHMLQELRK